jgi:hypothetical protein
MESDLTTDAGRAQAEIADREKTCSDKVVEIDAYTERVIRTKADL